MNLLAPFEAASRWFQADWTHGLLEGDEAIGYDVIKRQDPNRRPVRRRVNPADRQLRNEQRERAIATTQDIKRNFAVVAWAVRKHLDFVSTTVFKGDMAKEADNQAIESFIKGWSSRFRCDVRARHPLRRLIRMSEMHRTVDGDVFALKVGGTGRNRGKLQLIQAYRIQNGGEHNESEGWINGVKVGASGQDTRYAVWHRNMQGSLEFDAVIPAPRMVPLGYYEAQIDQVRGISPLMAGLAEFMDVMDSTQLMKSKLKLQQLFAFATFRDYNPNMTDGLPQGSGDQDQDGVADSDWEFDFSGKPQQVDGEPGDKFELLESRSPSTESVEFIRFILSIALKSLDLPDSFLKESETNFFGSRASLMQYLVSAYAKRADVSEYLDEITRWRVGMAIADGELQLSVPFEEVKWKWIHRGMPWAWDPVKEATGARMSIEAGIDSMVRICMLNGTDPKDNIDEYNTWADYAEKTYGRPLVLSNSPTTTASSEPVEESSSDETEIAA